MRSAFLSEIGRELPRGNRLAATSPETDTLASSAQKSVNVCTSLEAD
jgi:hypothetical protein